MHFEGSCTPTGVLASFFANAVATSVTLVDVPDPPGSTDSTSIRSRMPPGNKAAVLTVSAAKLRASAMSSLYCLLSAGSPDKSVGIIPPMTTSLG